MDSHVVRNVTHAGSWTQQVSTVPTTSKALSRCMTWLEVMAHRSPRLPDRRESPPALDAGTVSKAAGTCQSNR